MLQKLGEFLAILNQPLNAMGNGLQLNAAAYTAAADLADRPMSTVAFAAFAMPWIDTLGQMAVGLGNLMIAVNTFLGALSTAL